jgi:hypothetical protein
VSDGEGGIGLSFERGRPPERSGAARSIVVVRELSLRIQWPAIRSRRGAMKKRVPVWKKRRRLRSAWKKIKQFRSKELAVASSLIVLVSFTLKEEVSEHLKEKQANIESVLARIEDEAKGSEEAERLRRLGDRTDHRVNNDKLLLWHSSLT